MTVSRTLKITGKVQGVWYRASTQNVAIELGVKGFVRNEPDGSVYAEAEGEESGVEAFIQWCWKGPQFAQVKDIEIESQEVQGHEKFEIRR